VLSQHDNYGQGSFLNVEVAAPPGDFGAELASRVFDALERHLSRGSCYRGRVLSLETSPQWTGHAARIRVHDLEPVERDEVILPDATLRALYARSLELSPELMDDLARRTDGASPAFIKEFLRRIAQHHLDSAAQGNVTQATAEAALHEMLFSGGTLNTRLLGGEAVSNEAMGRST
jgi:hypothetical protein